jgi:hypothetical protein
MAKIMTLDERIAYAIKKRDESIRNDASYAANYWSGYIDALRAVKKSTEAQADN